MPNTFSRREILKLFGIAGAGAAVEGPAALAQLVEDNPQILPSVEELVKQTVALIRDLCRAQIEDWKKIPDLALEVDGREGYSAAYQLAYQDRVWKMYVDPLRQYGIYVDLVNGEFVNHNREPVADEFVLALGFQLQVIDAKAIVEDLQNKARQPHFHSYNVAEKEAWRAANRKKYGLKKPKL